MPLTYPPLWCPAEGVEGQSEIDVSESEANLLIKAHMDTPDWPFSRLQLPLSFLRALIVCDGVTMLSTACHLR